MKTSFVAIEDKIVYHDHCESCFLLLRESEVVCQNCIKEENGGKTRYSQFKVSAECGRFDTNQSQFGTVEVDSMQTTVCIERTLTNKLTTPVSLL